MTQSIVNFLILMNPFALFFYLLPLKKEIGLRRFIRALGRACVISYAVFLTFALSGDRVFQLLQIDFEAFRIFGGLVLVALSLVYIIQGKKSLITTTGELNRIAAEIALPFMVGVGTITLSIIIGQRHGAFGAVVAILVVMLLTFALTSAIALMRYSLKPRLRGVFDQNAEILLRINGFLIGAFGVNMIVTGLKNLML